MGNVDRRVGADRRFLEVVEGIPLARRGIVRSVSRQEPDIGVPDRDSPEPSIGIASEIGVGPKFVDLLPGPAACVFAVAGIGGEFCKSFSTSWADVCGPSCSQGRKCMMSWYSSIRACC